MKQGVAFPDLCDKAQEAVVRHFDSEDLDSDLPVLDHFQGAPASAKGFAIAHVHYSVGGGQGDGACWQGQIDTQKFIEAHMAPDDPKLHIWQVVLALCENAYFDHKQEVSTRYSQYSHSGCMYVYVDTPSFMVDRVSTVLQTLTYGPLAGADSRALLEFIDEVDACAMLQEWMEYEARAYADEIYKALVKVYDYQNSREYVADICEANEYRFTPEGVLL